MLNKDVRRRTEGSARTQITRRTVTRGLAWSVPAVSVVAAAPAFASTPPPLTVTQKGFACKHPGNPKFYHFTFCFKSNYATTVTLLKMVVNGETGAQIFPTTVVVPAGVEVCKHVDAGLFSNSANGQGELFYSYVVDGNPIVVKASIKTLVNDLPVCGSPQDDNVPKAPNDDPPHCGPLGNGEDPTNPNALCNQQ